MPNIFSNQAFVWVAVIVAAVALITLFVVSSRVNKILKGLSGGDSSAGSSSGAVAAHQEQVHSSVASSGIPAEVVAAISAAVAMLEGEGFVLQSITPSAKVVSSQLGRTGPGEWGFSARAELTQPF